MKVSFTGTTNHASVLELNERGGQQGLSHKLICTLDNSGKSRDLFEFGPILEEFPYKRNKTQNNVLIVEVFNKLSNKDLPELRSGIDFFLKNKYNPQADLITINGKPLPTAKNKIYIIEKIGALAKAIAEKSFVDFSTSKEYLQSEDCIRNILGDEASVSRNDALKQIQNFLSVRNIKINADCINKSAQNLIKKLSKY